MNIGPARFSYLPEVVKNLLIINALFFLGKIVLESSFGIDLDKLFGLGYRLVAYDHKNYLKIWNSHIVLEFIK